MKAMIPLNTEMMVLNWAICIGKFFLTIEGPLLIVRPSSILPQFPAEVQNLFERAPTSIANTFSII
jgi:hypothetical protein